MRKGNNRGTTKRKNRFTLNRYFLLTIPVALIMLGCRDINYVMPAYKPPVDIYLAGAKLNGTDTAWSATYWKNGVPTSLTDGLTNSSLFGVCVTDSGIYAA